LEKGSATSRNYPFFSTKAVVVEHDYIEEEYFVEDLAPELLVDGETTATREVRTEDPSL